MTDVVILGTPHLGAPLERGVALGAPGARAGCPSPRRSAGSWSTARSASSTCAADSRRDVENLPHARYHLVAATLATSRRHPVSETLGDLLVRYPSATGRPRRGPELFPGADVLHIRGGHFALLNHPQVYDALRTWLA